LAYVKNDLARLACRKKPALAIKGSRSREDSLRQVGPPVLLTCFGELRPKKETRIVPTDSLSADEDQIAGQAQTSNFHAILASRYAEWTIAIVVNETIQGHRTLPDNDH
jgi:hypothetical protein